MLLLVTAAMAGCSDKKTDASEGDAATEESVTEAAEETADDTATGTGGGEAPTDDVDETVTGPDKDATSPATQSPSGGGGGTPLHAPTLDDLQFTASATAGTIPLVVTFSTSGTGGLAFDWTLDPGGAGMDERSGNGPVDIQVTYNVPGTFTPQLVAQAGESTVTKDISIRIDDAACGKAGTLLYEDLAGEDAEDATNIVCFSALRTLMSDSYEGGKFRFQIQVADKARPEGAAVNYQINFVTLYGDATSYADNELRIKYSEAKLEADWYRWSALGGFYVEDGAASDVLTASWEGDWIVIEFPLATASKDGTNPGVGKKFQWIDLFTYTTGPTLDSLDTTKDAEFEAEGLLSVTAS